MRRVFFLLFGVAALAGVATHVLRAPDVRGRYEVFARLGDANGPTLDPPQHADKVRLGTSTRSAIQVTANSGFELAVDSANTRLLFSVGAQNVPTSGESPRFAVSAMQHGHWQKIFSTPADTSAAEWRDYVVDLDKVAPDSRALLFSTSAPSAVDASAAQLYWGSLRLLRPPSRFATTIAPLFTKRPNPLPNVILISLDTLNADHLSAFGNVPGTSPRIDDFLSQSFSFRRAYAQFPNTLVSHASLFTALYPKHHGVSAAEPSLHSLTLANVLADDGYATAAVTEDAYVSSDFGFDLGFDSYDNGSATTATEITGNAKATFANAAAWLHEYGSFSRFLLFVHTYEIHAPYAVHDVESAALVGKMDPGYKGSFEHEYPGGLVEMGYNKGAVPLTAGDLTHLAALYAADIHYTDELLETLLSEIAKLGLAENTIVILTSDHGEEFGEHGKLGHGETLHKQALHVPLAFRWPGKQRNGASPTPVQLIDVMPTVLDLIGAPVPPDLDGRSLAATILGTADGAPSRPAFAELDVTPFSSPDRLLARAVQTERFKLIASRLPPFEALYDTTHDPEEQRDVAEEFPNEVLQLRALLDAYDATSPAPRPQPASSPQGVDNTTRERLRALGYTR